MNFDRLTSYLDSLDRQGIPCVDLMICKNGDTLYRHYAGFRDVGAHIRLDGKELYQAYSLSKPITAAAALILWEKGAFRLDDPVYAYIPEFRDIHVRHDCAGADPHIAPARSTMTIRHLFTMASGICYDLALPAIKNAVAQTKGQAPTLSIAKAIASAPLAFEPGSGFRYSLSHDVLAAVVEVIAGVPFREYVAKTVFAPCAMTESGFHIRPEDAHRFATQYRFDSASGCAVPMAQTNEFVFGPDYDSGGAGLCCSTEDLMRLARMLARKGVADSGERILRADTIDRMRANQLSDTQLTDFSKLGFPGYGYGLGVRTMVDPKCCGAESPAGEFGWYGAAGGYLLADPDNGIAICCNMQLRNAPVRTLHPQIRDLCYQCLSD